VTIIQYLPDASGAPICEILDEDEVRPYQLLELISASEGAPSVMNMELKNTLAGGAHDPDPSTLASKFPVALRSNIKKDIENVRKKLDENERDPMFGRSGKWHCPCCALNVFSTKRWLADHFHKMHELNDLGTPSTKHQGVMRAMWDARCTDQGRLDMSRGTWELNWVSKSRKVYRAKPILRSNL
jgi:hypothetical protein